MLILPRRRSGFGASSFVPTNLGSKLKIWIDGEDNSVMYEDEGAVTQASNNSEVRRIDEKGQATSDNWLFSTRTNTFYTNGPVWNSNGYLVFDSVDVLCKDGENTWGGTDLRVFWRLRTSDTGAVIFGTNNSNRYGAVIEDGSASTTLQNGIGTISYEINGSAFSGTTRDDLHTDVATGSWVTLSMLGVDTSPNTFIGLQPQSNSLPHAYDLAQYIITTNDLTGPEESDLENWLSGKSPT